jgi:ATP-dependent DNA helicase RecG
VLDLTQQLDRYVGKATAKVLASGLELHTVGDLLRHYPRRYIERGELTELDKLRVDEEVTVAARVARANVRRMRNRRGALLEVVVTDGHGELTLTFFGKSEGSVAWRTKDLAVGRIGLFAGKVGVFKGQRQLTHPDYLMLRGADDPADAAEAYADELIPVYPATEKLKSWRIAQCVETVLGPNLHVADPIPMSVRQRFGLMDAGPALLTIHRPTTLDDVERAKHRLRFEEAFVLQVELARRRASAAAFPAVPRPGGSAGVQDALDRQLPFSLTDGQRAVGDEIFADLAGEHPMYRLLQGEVGSGKTVVALRAMLRVVDSGGQAVLLAPTEVLAQQHYRSLTALMGPLAEGGMLGGAEHGTRIALLTGSLGAAARRSALLAAASGDAGIVIGTHALLEENVQFADLGLVVVDEQHRFGVEQRAALSAKGVGLTRPHVLVMTATPIPRTVAMTVFGDLWVSTLSEIPAGRADVVTHVVPAADKPRFVDRIWERVHEEVDAGHQVYIVCPRIGDEGTDDSSAAPPGAPSSLMSVLELSETLRAGPLADIEIGILHGRMHPEAKDDAMRRFVSGAAPVLVCTTVVEVGVDVSTASMMVVMDADRFGVSQLHQMRGRVGRGSVPGLCLLVTETPADTPAGERLEAVAATRDGFKLAQVDLEQRREGDVLGASQSGRRSSLRLLRVLRHENIIMNARDAAASIITDDPDLARHPDLAAAVDVLVDEQRADYLDKA